MLIRDIRHCRYFTATDGTTLCELLHPAREPEPPALRCSIAHARLGPGRTSTPHRLRTSAEVYIILEGAGLMHIENDTAEVRPGQAVYIPPNATQWVENTGAGELVFLCIVDPMWRVEDEG